MKELQLLRKVAVGSAVDAFLAGTSAGTVLVQLSHPEIAADPELYGRFLDTTRSASRSHRHPALLSVQETHCEPDGRFVLVSGPASGRTAADQLRTDGPLTGREVKRWALRLCDALEFLHAHGVVHGNLAPRNVFLDGDLDRPEVRLLDTALLLFRGTKSVPVASVLVAPEYLSPERCAGQRASAACDVYGLGVLLHELLTGDPPFSAVRDAIATRTLHLTAPLPPLFPGLEEWEPVLRRCLAKDAIDRPSLAVLREELLALTPLETPAIVVEPAVEPPLVLAEDSAPVVGVLLGDDVSSETALDRALEQALRELEGRAADTLELTDVTTEPEVGDVIGRYRLDRLLGEGGMGQVFEATNLGIGRKVALKLLRAELAKIDGQVRRFVAEAQAVNRVKHPNIIEVEDLVNDGERVYFVMELLDGKSLKVVAREAPVELVRIVRWMRQAAEALSAAHGVGVIHRDLKPDNLVLTVDRQGTEQIKVLDFGVARIRGLDAATAFKTQVGQVVGTPLWMAPEQVLGQEVDARADVYSLMMVMYVLVCRRFPFEGDLSQVVMSRLAREAKPLGDSTFLGEPVPEALRSVLRSSLSRDRGQRPATMDELARTLRALERELVTPDAEPEPEPRRSWWNRWRS